MHLQTAILSQVQKKSNPLMKDVLPSFSAKKKNIFWKLMLSKLLKHRQLSQGLKPLQLFPEHFRYGMAGVRRGELDAKVKSDP